MLLGTILHRLGREADAAEALDALGDLVLLAEIRATGERYEETPAEYICGATRRFAADGSSEDWLALMTAIERSTDPARTTLDHMLRWSLKRDEAEPAEAACGCGKGGSGDAPR